MSDETLNRFRDTLRRSQAGDPAARRELEDRLREASPPDPGTRDGGGGDASTSEIFRLVEEARECLSATVTQGPDKDDVATVPASAWLPNVPGYEVLDVLGRGGMGVVYRARQLGFKRIVALKMIAAGAAADPAECRRFRIEAEAVARLRHPNIVQVHDIGEAGGCPYFSMEYLDGGSLARRTGAGPLSPREAAELVESLARAMQHAHEAGVVHRDLKPSNVLLDAAGTPKVVDFGLARLLDNEATRTAPDSVLGTACYMAPEQAGGTSSQVGPAADVYGLGALLYDLLTGQPPVERGSWAVVLDRVRTQEPTDPRWLRPEVDRDLEAVCLKCLRKEPARRYASAAELADDLRRWLDGRPTVARPLGWAGRAWRGARRRPLTAAAVALLLLGVLAAPLAWYFLDPERVPKDNLVRLERGEEVTLIEETGPPRWSKWVLGQHVTNQVEADPAFTLGTGDRHLLELMPAMPADGFVLRAQIRQNYDLQGARVGLYFGYERRPSPTGTEHCWATFSFNEFPPDGAPRPETRATVYGERCRPPTLYDAPAAPTLSVSFPAHVPLAPPMPWRDVKLRLTPDDVQVWCDGRTDGPRPMTTLREDFNDLNAFLKHKGESEIHPDLGPRHGVGLFVFRASASFRRVVAEPLRETSTPVKP
jgi:serine/threonine-protein kinase